MGAWTIYTFECSDKAAVDAFREFLAANHPVEFPADAGEQDEFGTLDLSEAGSTGADFAWLGNYLYVTMRADDERFLTDTIGFWERAAVGEMDATTETCTTATLYADEKTGEPITVATYEGLEGVAGTDVVFAMAMHHQFRFRVYSAQSPTSQMTFHACAYDAIDPSAEEFAGLAEHAGVEVTPEGLAFLENDLVHQSDDACVGSGADSGEPVADGGTRSVLGRLRDRLGL